MISKTMAKFYITVFLIVLQSNISLSNKLDLITGELIIRNDSNIDILKVEVYPIGAIFNGDFRYSLNSVLNQGKKIIGGSKQNMGENVPFTLDHDNAEGTGADSTIGYGRYRVVFFRLNLGNYDSVDYCDVDFSDADYPSQYPCDITLYYYSSSDIKFGFFGSNYYPISAANRYLKSWDQYGGSVHRTQNKYGFSSDSLYLYYPINAVDSGAIAHLSPGDFYLNVEINHNIYTRETLINPITNMIITKKAALFINSNKIFDMITPSSPSGGYTNLIVQDSGYLILRPSSKIHVRAPNRIILKNRSFLIQNFGSQIIIYEGASFCNEGGNIYGPGKILFSRGVHPICRGDQSEYIIEDSSKIVLDSNAIVEFPNNTVYRFKGNTTSLIMSPTSKIKFGENSGLVFENGANIIANNAEFSSIDSTKKWNGITLSGLSFDNIKNCVIKNADAISIIDKLDDDGTSIPYSTEISGCTFINQTNSDINGINISESNNVLIKSNTFSATSGGGFQLGIYTEYCQPENFIICDNTINNAKNSIVLIQSSLYVARNNITGSEGSEYGFFLDNSNGTLEYNSVSSCQYPYYSLYSSPNLLKNIFKDGVDQNIFISTYSVPVMRPLQDDNLIYWFAGDNLINGSPSNSGMYFENESFPDMNNGYNRFILPSTPYYMEGGLPSTYSKFILNNYWGGVPEASKFNVTGGELDYDPYDDNSSAGRSTDYYELYDIGFVLYDSVFVKDESDNSTVAELFLQAYIKEYSKQYSQAITTYKNIVSTYEDSIYAASSLTRIFNCYEKKNSTVSEFSLLETYYNNISEDTSHISIIRNIAEDFTIKCKVNQGMLQDAIEDYNYIYNQNINTPKGIHALLNKEILQSLQGDTTDNAGTSSFNIEKIKSNKERISSILSSLINDHTSPITQNVLPDKFYLSQNYPNPFNPVTIINYQIPFENKGLQPLVLLKVYNVLGNEVVTLVNEKQNVGSYSIEFSGNNLSSGIYFYKLLINGNTIDTKRMVLLK